jgi:hypothetical protein
MRKRMAIASAIVFGSTLLLTAFARQQSGHASEKSAPTGTAQEKQPLKPAPEMERLKFLQGKWRYTESYPQSSMVPNGGTGSGTYAATPGPGGFSQIADFQGISPEGNIAGHEVITWDPAEKVYKSYVFGNNFPGCFMKKGHWNGNELVFTGDFQFQSSRKRAWGMRRSNPC